MRSDVATTLVELLEHRRNVDADRTAFCFLPDGSVESARLSYAETFGRATAIGAALQALGAAGQRVLITYPGDHLEEYVTGFLGCVMAGAVAVPCDSPRSRGGAERLGWIAGDSQPSVVLGPATDSRHPGLVVPGARHLDVAEVPDSMANDWRRPDVMATSLALLQYTSGSTRSPRGVRVMHRNVLANERAIATSCEHDQDSHFVGWLPLFHDMGLIADVLQPLYLGATSVLMPPAAFLADPLRWLTAIGRYRGVGGGGPNFSFELCVSRVPEEQRHELDLSTWRTAFNGAEIVREATIGRFSEAFGPAGFAPESFFSCYGLAEATLIVAGAPRRRPPVVMAADVEAERRGRLQAAGDSSAVRSVVSSGRVVVDTDVAIVHADTGTRLPSGSIGEVWVRGAGVADGYWGADPPSESFAGLVTDDTAGPYLRTGDLGAMIDDELFLVGRVKDLIIVRGANHHPADIEWTVEHCTGEVRPSCVAAFSAPEGGLGDERVVIVCEPVSERSAGRLSEIASDIRAAVAHRHGLAVHDIVLAARGTVTKTTSGKVRRSACRAAYGAGTIDILGRSRDASVAAQNNGSIPDPVELLAASDAVAVDLLAAGIMSAVGVAVVDGPVPGGCMSVLGLDSLRAVQLQHSVQSRLGVVLPPFTFVGDRALNEICLDLLRRLRADAVPAAPRVPAGEEGPASLVQTAMLLEQEMAPPGPAYVLTRALRIRGDLDVTALRRALGRVVERHPALTTTLRLEGGEARQAQHSSSDRPLLDERDLDGDLRATLVAEASRPLPVQIRPVRFTLLRCSTDDHVLVLAAHHALVDFWSAVLVVRELFALYGEEVGGSIADLPTPGIGPVEQAIGQLALSSGAEGETLRHYWATRLGGAPPVTALPRSRPRPTVRMFHGATARSQVDRAVVSRLRELAGMADCTLFTVLLTALQVLLARTSGSPDVVVGTFAAQRNHPSLGYSVGCLTNLLPVRVVIDPDDDVPTLLRRVHSLLGGDLARSDLPFSEIVRAAAPERDTSRSTLVQTAIVLQQEPGRPDGSLRALALGVDGSLADGPPGLNIDVVEVGQRWAHLDVTLQVAEIDGSLSVVAEYDAAAFEPHEMHDVMDRWRALLEAFVKHTDQPIGRLPLLSKAAHAQAVAQGTGPVVVAEPLPLHALVEKRWTATPDHIAIVADRDGSRLPEHLSAAVAQRWVNELQRRLTDAGVRAGSRVGILLDRSAGLPIAMLAVMRLGAAYVPLDPSDPPDRIAWTVADARITAVICDGSNHVLPHDMPQISVEPGGSVPPGHGSRVRGHRTNPELPAYVMYTSGSSGRQKGVVVPHRAIVNRLRWMQRAIPLAVGERVLHRTPTTFDVSLWELFWPLMEGATLVIAPPGIHREPDRLADLARRQQVEIMHAVPTALGHLLPHLVTGPRTPLALRRMVCSGETLTPALRDRFLRSSNAELFNLYGPTEAAVDVSWWRCRSGEAGPVPIGLPIDATEIHVVGPEGAPTPSGVEGELVIGGAPLAHGYAGRPGLTARSWRPHPFSGRPGERLYLTGDRAVRRADGAVLFLGRLDHQIQLSGRRVELGEVEDALRTLPEVTDAVVTVEDGVGGPRLVGHVVPAGSTSVDDVSASEFSSRLRRLLPATLVPSVVHPIRALPMTINGKLDRRGLARRGGATAAPESVAAEPMPPLQMRIAAIWSEVLGCPPVRSDDDFFAVVGDSITALRVVAALQTIGLDVRVAELLANPTVRSLAGVLLHRGAAVAPMPTTAPFALCPSDVRDRLPPDVVDVFPVSSAQLAVLFHQLHGRRHEVYVTSLKLRGPFDRIRMLDSLRAVSSRHPYLRSRLDLTLHREPIQIVLEALELPLQIVDLRGLPESDGDESVASWCEAERTRPIDVEHGPLARITVHIRDDSNWHITLSSFALDGWATATVLTEVLAHHHRAQVLPSPLSDYRTFVALERAAATDPDHRRYWSEELSDAPVSKLPHRATPTRERTTRRIEIPMDPSIAASMVRLARRLGVADRTLLLAAHLRVVRALTGVRDVVTGVEWSGRPEEQDGDRVVGVFNNILPLRVAVNGTWTGLIHATAAAERRAAPFRRYPLAQVERDLGRPGLLTTMFVHTHFHLYRDLEERAGVEVRGGWAPDRTYVPLTAHTNVDASTGRIRLLLDVDSQEVDERTIALATALYPAAWRAMISDPDASCIADGLIGPHELLRQMQLDEGAPAPVGPASALHLIAQQSGRTPDRVALVADGRQLSYRGLMDRASSLGGALRAAGVRPDTVVAVPARRTVEVVTSMLAVWEAGAAYLPIDPDDPIDRITRPLRAARVTHAVATRAEPWTTVVDTVIEPDTKLRAGTTRPTVDPRLLAYVLPTSGSTGVPKLVAVPHGALVNYLLWCSENYRVEARTPVHSPVGFDLTITALLAPLVAGGTVELLSDRAGPEAVGSMLGGFDGVLKITPAHLAAVADQVIVMGARLPADLMAVVGGEPLTGQHVQAWRDAGGIGPIVNEYGPTEATVGCVAAVVPAGTPPDDVPVGRPLPGTRARVLDESVPVPDGVEGELAVGGLGLARGYLGAPGATASRFVPDPQGNGQRLYLTGDRCRRDTDGQLHVHGRGDRQVKIRGRRIEPAAVEAVIRAHPSVQAAVVTVFDAHGDGGRLVGYWVSDAADEPGAPAITAWVRSRLAAHEIPDMMMWLPILPLTVRGKVDRIALPDPRLGTEAALAALVSRLPDGTVAELLAREETATA